MTQAIEPERDLRRDLSLLVALFLLARAMAIFWFTPVYSEFSQFFFGFAALSDGGKYPFVDYWLEYPPVFPWLSVGVYKAVAFFVGHIDPAAVDPVRVLLLHRWYVAAMQVLMALFDAGSLALIILIARERWGDRPSTGSGRSELVEDRAAFRAGWVYALLFYPALVAMSYFDGFVLFWLLLSVWLFLRGRNASSAFALAVGVMAKVIPVVFLPVALRCLPTWRSRLAYAGCFAAGAALLAGPFAARDPAMATASVKVMAERGPWETVWALLEGRAGCGTVEPPDTSPAALERRAAAAGPRAARIAYAVGIVYPSEGDRLSGLNRLLSRFSDPRESVERRRGRALYDWAALPALAALVWLLWRAQPSAGSGRRGPVEARGGPQAEPVLALSLALLALLLVASKGWSPQFAVYPTALCLLALGPGEGMVFAVILNIVNYIEMPMWLTWPSLTGRASPELLVVAVCARTVLLALVLVRAARRLGSRA